MSQGFSPNLQHLETSATIAISQEAKRRRAAGEDVIDLGAGEPDFPTPSIPTEAGLRAIREGKTHYPANEGILELRAAAAQHLSVCRAVNADNTVVSTLEAALFNVCHVWSGRRRRIWAQGVVSPTAAPVCARAHPEWSLKAVCDLERVVPGRRG
jgi:hypothetical protein